MRKYLLGFLLLAFSLPLFGQLDSLNVTITNYRLHEGTFNWRGTNTYHDRTSWDSSPYIEGHLKKYNGEFRQNFRLLVPQGYDPNYKPGYPIMLVWHGGVERANCHGTNCYYGTRTYNPNTQPVPTAKSDIENLLNNDHNLLNGGSMHLNAWKAAGTMKVGDPGLSTRAFPGFVVFPQMLNGWNNGDIRDAVRIVRLLMKQYNIDPDRVYTHGLSFGGRGLLNSLVDADWLFAAAATMSAIPTHNNFRNNLHKVSAIPMWFFQGGQDTEPTPAVTETTVRLFREAGGSALYTLYPELGHGTWNKAYREPEFFPFFLGRTKRDIHVAYGVTEICPTTNTPVKLSVVKGLYAYQWQRNGVTIPDATSHVYEASQPGVYRARFSRISATPTEAEWNEWSAPVTITMGAPVTPKLEQVGSIVLRDLNNNNTARLLAEPGAYKYEWYKDGVLTAFKTYNPVIQAGANPCVGPCPNGGTYTVVTSSLNQCTSGPSNPKTVFFSNQAPLNIPRPTGFTATLAQPTTVVLRWTDVSGLERNYELWRRKSTETVWTFVSLLNEDATSYEDRNLESATEYWYKIRAVSNTGRSDYAPGNSKTEPAENVIISTGNDITPPAVPQNLTAQQLDTDISTKTVSIVLTWSPVADEDLKQYVITYGGTTINTGKTETRYVVANLPLNRHYQFTVQSQDMTGNISAPGNQASAHTYIDGFFWYHSTGAYTNMNEIPATAWTRPEFTGRSANLSLEDRTQEEFFVFRFYGYVYVTTPGNYIFRTRSNDGVEMFINGQSFIRRNSMVNNGVCATSSFASGTSVYLETGPHSIEVRYFQYWGDKCLSFQWKGPDAGPNPNNFYDVPDIRVRSYEVMEPPFLPIPAENLAATATGMTTIDLKWDFTGTPPVSFQVYRSMEETGTYTVVSTVAAQEYQDTGLVPGTTYYYKLRTVNESGSSEFSSFASATTFSDTEAPTAPTNLTLYAVTLSTASIGWTASTDNTRVEGYEIYVNGIFYGTAQNNYAELTGLEPLTKYEVYVLAYDPSGNKSEPSNIITFDTAVADIFYSKPSGNLNEVVTWGKEPDGTGPAPLNFETNGSYFVVSNRTETNSGGPWRVEGNASKIIVPSGITLMLENAVTGRVEVDDNALLVLDNPTIPTVISAAPLSTVQYNNAALEIQQISYGNLVLQGTAHKTFAPGTTVVRGNLVIAADLDIKGATGNGSFIELQGDLICSGTSALAPSNVSVGLNLTKQGTQTLNFNGGLSFYRLSTVPATTAVFNSLSPGVVMLGSQTGGGLSLATGSVLKIGNNTLQIEGSGTINNGGETGTLDVSGGNITVNSGSAAASRLFFDAANNRITKLTTNLRNNGNVFIESPVVITDGLKVKNGSFHSNGNVVLESTPDKTANLEEIEGNGRVIGTVHAQRYFNYKANTYRYIASPVEGTRVADWQQYFQVTGDFNGSSTTSKSATLWIWEPLGWTPYPRRTNPAPHNDNQAPIEKGRGYAALIRNTAPFTLVNSGVPHQGQVTFSLFPRVDGVEHGEWNLVANPYASTIAWSLDPEAWTTNDLGSVVAVRNNFNSTSGQFQYFDGATGLGIGQEGDLEGGRIAPGQAFYVNTIGPNPQLSVTERAKSTGQQTFFRETHSTASHLRIRLASSTQYDEALIIFSEKGKDTLDPAFDGLKFSNVGLFNLASNKNDVTLAISHQNDAFCSKSIGLSLSQVSVGTYSLSVESTATLPGVENVTLVDHFTGATTDFTRQSAYTFSVTSDPASSGRGRFEIRLQRPELNTDLNTAIVNDCESASVSITNAQAGATYQLRRGDGSAVSEEVTAIEGPVTFSVPNGLLPDGKNSLVISASFKGCAQTMINGRVVIDKLTAPGLESRDITLCHGARTTITVPGFDNVAAYEWADSTGVIKGANRASYTTGNITAETTFSVRPVLKNGCKGEAAMITVVPQLSEVPEVIFENDTLYTTVLGSEYKWLLDGTILTGETNPFLVPRHNGAYSITVRSGECEKTSRALSITGLEEPAAADYYELYPNPTTPDQIQIRKVRDGRAVDLRITDVLGREIYSTSTTGSSGVIHLQPRQPLSSGVYFLLLDDGAIRKQIRFVIRAED